MQEACLSSCFPENSPAMNEAKPIFCVWKYLAAHAWNKYITIKEHARFILNIKN